MSIYEQMKAAGIETDNHESDLYVPATPESKEIIKSYHHREIVTSFISQIDGKLWYDIPFAFDPWWQARAK